MSISAKLSKCTIHSPWYLIKNHHTVIQRVLAKLQLKTLDNYRQDQRLESVINRAYTVWHSEHHQQQRKSRLDNTLFQHLHLKSSRVTQHPIKTRSHKNYTHFTTDPPWLDSAERKRNGTTTDWMYRLGSRNWWISYLTWNWEKRLATLDTSDTSVT